MMKQSLMVKIYFDNDTVEISTDINIVCQATGLPLEELNQL